MALRAGRVGVRDDQVDTYGRITGNSYELPTATATRLGGIKVGDGLSVNSSGKLSANVQNIPVASADTLGGVKVGEGLSISDGVLSANVQNIPVASADTLGGVKVGSGLSITDGVLSSSGGVLTPPSFTVGEKVTADFNESLRIGNIMLVYITFNVTSDVAQYDVIGSFSDITTESPGQQMLRIAVLNSKGNTANGPDVINARLVNNGSLRVANAISSGKYIILYGMVVVK